MIPDTQHGIACRNNPFERASPTASGRARYPTSKTTSSRDVDKSILQWTYTVAPPEASPLISPMPTGSPKPLRGGVSASHLLCPAVDDPHAATNGTGRRMPLLADKQRYTSRWHVRLMIGGDGRLTMCPGSVLANDVSCGERPPWPPPWGRGRGVPD